MRAIVILMAALAAVQSTGADALSGVYTGTFTPGGGGRADALTLVLDVRESSVRASLGPTEESQRTVDSPALAGDSLQFTYGAGPNSIQVTLNFDGTGRAAGEARRGKDAPGTLTFTRSRALSAVDLAPFYPPLAYEDADVRSPRLLALRDQLAGGNRAALSQFWADAARDRTPLVEAAPGTDRSVLVTFLWRGDSTSNVLLERGRFTFQQPPARHLFAHVPETDIWFRTLRLQRGARFTYLLSENDPLGSLPPGAGPRGPRLDPLNPRVESQTPNVRRSFAELPGAPPQPWLARRDGVPPLTLNKERIVSQILGNERDLLIYTPPSYRTSGAPYPTVYLTDADDPGGPIFATTTIENLIAAGEIPSVVIVRIGNVAGGRSRELRCNPDFGRFLSDELVPLVRARYHVSTAPMDTILGGESLGGLTAACTGLAHADVFGSLLIQSGSFWWTPDADGGEPNWVAREVLRRPRLPLRIFMTAGTFEVDLSGTGGNILETSRHLRDVLRAKGYDAQYLEFAGDHEFVNWRGTLADGLIALFNSPRGQ